MNVYSTIARRSFISVEKKITLILMERIISVWRKNIGPLMKMYLVTNASFIRLGLTGTSSLMMQLRAWDAKSMPLIRVS